MVISKRLQQIADMVTFGSVPADIGTDHAYVPIRLVKNGVCPKAFAMDIGTGPLSRAREHILVEGLEDRIETRLSDGLAALRPGEADTVIIAGMGGALTVRILDDGARALEQVKTLVLSPHSEIEKVRSWTEKHGYEITDEEMLIEDGKYYTVMRAERVTPELQGKDTERATPEPTGKDMERQTASGPDTVPGSDLAPGPDAVPGSDLASGPDAVPGSDLAPEPDKAAGDIPEDLLEEVYLRYGRILIGRSHPVLIQALEKEEQLCRNIMSGCPKTNTGRIGELEHRLEMIRTARRLMNRVDAG